MASTDGATDTAAAADAAAATATAADTAAASAATASTAAAAAAATAADTGGTTVAVAVLARASSCANADTAAHQIGWADATTVTCRCRRGGAVARTRTADACWAPTSVAPLASDPIGALADTTVNSPSHAA